MKDVPVNGREITEWWSGAKVKFLPYTIHQNKYHVNKRLKCEIYTIEFSKLWQSGETVCAVLGTYYTL